jgi:hypothetical protein
MNRLIFIFLISIFAISCQQYKTADALIIHFYEKKPQLDLLITNLQADKELDSLFRISLDSTLPILKSNYPNAYNTIKNCSITKGFSCSNAFQKGTTWYYFETNWPSKNPILLSCNTKNANDSTERIKGFYKKDQYNNEWWGLGDGWQMLRLVKEIDYFKQ